MDKLLGIIFSSIMIGFGVLCLNSGFVKEIVKMNNALRGLKTTVTPDTFVMWRYVGYVVITIGLILLLIKLFS